MKDLLFHCFKLPALDFIFPYPSCSVCSSAMTLQTLGSVYIKLAKHNIESNRNKGWVHLISHLWYLVMQDFCFHLLRFWDVIFHFWSINLYVVITVMPFEKFNSDRIMPGFVRLVGRWCDKCMMLFSISTL